MKINELINILQEYDEDLDVKIAVVDEDGEYVGFSYDLDEEDIVDYDGKYITLG